ncbi:MAG: dihydrofolate reductase [Beijerinckiaceae bacterium]|nr:dihydrofolate reductase [Beijerinckiaceae bacterium]MCI0735071.1 dihydrofolate reductase [Beijerinckiaceae bacterium]
MATGLHAEECVKVSGPCTWRPAAPVPLAVVAAIGENGVIGDGRGLPWHLPSDLKHFRKITMGKPLLMGRKTFESIGRALPGRETIVVTRGKSYEPPCGGSQAGTIHVAHDLDTALALAQARAQALGAEEVILAGGGNLYESLIYYAERMHLTLVDLAPRGAVRFPAVDWSNWLEIGRVRPRPMAKDEATFAFVDFDRRGCLSL